MEPTKTYEYIVVGTGITGAQAVETLLDANREVLVLDVAYKDEGHIRFPEADFMQVRRTVENQRTLFLGENYEGIPWGKIKTGSQLTPARKYIIEGVDKWLRLESDTFFPYESLAYGGLGNAWGAGCYMFSEEEFKKLGIKREALLKSYQKVATRVGLTKPDEEGAKYSVEGLEGLMPAIKLENAMQGLMNRYQANKDKWNQRGFALARPSVAICTENRGDRKAFEYEDMEYWQDNRKSVYRTGQAFDALLKRNNVRLELGKLVISFKEENEGILVQCIDVNTNENITYRCRKLVLCPGVLGTARIVLRSLNPSARLPLLTNPYAYVPMLSPRLFGTVPEDKKNGMGQLVLYYDAVRNNSDVSMAALFTYRSLLLFRLVKETPLNFSDSRILQQFLAPALVIAGIHHSAEAGGNKFLSLKRDDSSPTGDVLSAIYTLSDEEKEAVRQKEKEYFRVFRSLGCYPLRKIDPGLGSSIHYAGTLPFSDTEQPLTIAKDGRLHGTRNVFVADGSPFKFLPAKGISFTLMANAERVAANSLL